MERHSRRKVILIIVASVIMITALIAYSARPETFNPIENAVSAIQKPAAEFFSGVGEFFSSIPRYFAGVDATAAENEALKLEILELQHKLAEYSTLEDEVSHLRELIDIYETNPDFQYTAARIIGQDSVNEYFTLTINKGSNDGIERLDTVVTESGLLGYISEVGATTARITTVLSTRSNVGVIITRTGEYALLQGDYRLAEDGLCRLTLLPESGDIVAGDIIETSGISDIYPRGLIVGRVADTAAGKADADEYASVSPVIDFEKVREVFVITGDKSQADEIPQNN